MKQKIRTLISSMTLSVTALLLVLIVFAWYATNKVANVTGGAGSTASNDYRLELQRGVYNATDSKADSNGIVWTDTSNMAFSNISPGNVFYFRIKIDGDENSKYTVHFGDVSSSLMDNKLTVVGSNVCLDDGFDTVLYAISNSKVTVASKTLYSIDSSNNISLSDYLIHTVFYVYDYGTTEMTPADSAVTGTGTAISSFTSGVFTITSSANYYYFAMEFNESASEVTMPDGSVNSNCYLYQKIYIGNISVDAQK